MPSRSDTEYVRAFPPNMYVYVNAATGQQFISGVPPTAAQQASFAQRNPGVNPLGGLSIGARGGGLVQVSTPGLSVASASTVLSEDEYVRPLFGNMYVYVNAATGQEYISGVPPTAAQQASFAQRNPGVDPLGGGMVQVSTPGLSVDSAGAIAGAAETARDQGAASQNPSVAGVNEDSDDQSSDTESLAPPKLPQASPPVDVTEDPAEQSVDDPEPESDSDSSGVTGPGSALIETFDTSAAAQSYIYRAVKVTHYFKGGKFTQQLNGALVIYDLPTPPNNED